LTNTSFTDIAATGATWKCLTGCTLVSGNTGMNFSWTNYLTSGDLQSGSFQ
jgi:protein gp37